MQKRPVIGITRASMRSSKSVKKNPKQKAVPGWEKSSKRARIAGGVKKTANVRRRRGGARRIFKDSIKMRKANLKANLRKKVVREKKRVQSGRRNLKSKNGSRRRSAKDKENKINGLQSRKTHNTLSKSVLLNLENNLKSHNQGEAAATENRIPFGAIIEDISAEDMQSEIVEVGSTAGDVSKTENSQKETVMTIETKQDEPQVTQFYEDILNYIMSPEARVEPKNYFYKSLFPARVRTVFVNWLIKIHNKFDLCDRTYFLAVNIFDRYLGENPVKKEKLKVLICASLLVASKFEEILFNELRDYQIVSNFEFTQSGLLDMEADILKTLGFRIFQTCHMSMIEIIRKHYELQTGFSKMVIYLLKLCTMNPLICFSDSAGLVVGVCCYVIKQCFGYVNPRELSRFLKKNELAFDDEFDRIILENRIRDDCILRKKAIGLNHDASLLIQLEKMISKKMKKN